MKRVGPLSILVAVLALPRLGAAESVDDRFERGQAEFGYKNFGNAIKILEPLLYPAVQLTQEDDIVKAHELLGLAQFYIGAKDKAKEEFTRLLFLRPKHELDPFLVPPPAVSFFEQIRDDPDMKAKLEKIEKERLEKEKQALLDAKPPRSVVRRIYYERPEEHHSRLWAFLPFGLGQFKNGHTTKGILLASGQGLALLTNVVSYIVYTTLADENGKFAEADLDTAQAVRITAWVSLGALVAAYVYGVIDANIYFEPVVTGPFRKTKEEEETQDAKPSALSPVLVPGGAGLSFEARF